MSKQCTTNWIVDEQQCSLIREVFDLVIHDEPVKLTLNNIDKAASLSIGQNRPEMAKDPETMEIMAMYMGEGVAFPMPLVWKATVDSKAKYVVLDGNHRTGGSLENRGEPSCPAILVTGDRQVAQQLALIVNTLHGRSTREPGFVALAMRTLREQGMAIPLIARMFGVSDTRVGVMTRREVQLERIRLLVPDRRGKVPAHTLDLLGQIEDEHVRVLGELFIDAPKLMQDEMVRRLREAASGLRDAVAHEILGELRESDRNRRKVKATTSRPATQLQHGLQRIVNVIDPTGAWYSTNDHARAILRSQMDTAMPRLKRLWAVIHEHDQQLHDEAEVA